MLTQLQNGLAYKKCLVNLVRKLFRVNKLTRFAKLDGSG
jgi:hypothetical protein